MPSGPCDSFCFAKWVMIINAVLVVSYAFVFPFWFGSGRINQIERIDSNRPYPYMCIRTVDDIGAVRLAFLTVLVIDNDDPNGILLLLGGPGHDIVLPVCPGQANGSLEIHS